MATESAAAQLGPKGHSPDEIRAWINDVCDRLAVKPTPLAKRAGLAPSTVNRFLNGSGPNRNVGAETIEALVDAAVEIWTEKVGKSLPESPRPPARQVSPAEILLVNTYVVGHVQAGVFQEALEWPSEKRYRVQVPVRGLSKDIPTVGLEVRGASMNRIYEEGTVLICVSFYDLERQPLSGERVIVHRSGENGIEATVKEYIVDPNGHAWLTPRSNHPDFQQSIYLGKNTHDEITDDELKISLLVIGSYRPEPSLYPPTVEEQKRLAKITDKVLTFGSGRG